MTDARVVDTGPISGNGRQLINVEAAKVSGPLSLQGEFFYCLTHAGEGGDPNFWGFYAYASYFLTGEHRRYDLSRGRFTGIKRKEHLHPFKAEWGAWELGLRFSYIDLNNEEIRGGRAGNLTAGLNWYIKSKGRVMFNYIHGKVWDRESPPVDGNNIDIFQIRFQFTF